MSPISVVAGLVLVTIASELRGRITATIFTLTAVTLFTCSALYHRVNWKIGTQALWRRIDHANIPILIAGTYTPFAIFLLDKTRSIILLSAVWGGALLIAILRVTWLNAPRWLYVIGYIALGWAAVFYIPTFWRNGGVAVFILIVIGGILYSAGGVIYALKKPNFAAQWFGFHELFHSFTAAAFLCHFAAAVIVLIR
jgi:hemolysin III